MLNPAITLDPRSRSADWPSLRGWQRLALMSVIVSLPVPLLAASGLAVPLPSIVYRVAVGFAERTQAVAVGVPGFGAVVAETTDLPRRGTIRLSQQELAEARSSAMTDRADTTAALEAEAERMRRSSADTTAKSKFEARAVLPAEQGSWVDARETEAATTTTVGPLPEALAQPSPDASHLPSQVSENAAEEQPLPAAPSSSPSSSPADTPAPAPHAERPASDAPKSEPAKPKDEATGVVPDVSADPSDDAADAAPPVSTPGQSGEQGSTSSGTPPDKNGEGGGRPDTPPGQSSGEDTGRPDTPPGQSSGEDTGRADTPPGQSGGGGHGGKQGGESSQPPSEPPTPPETPGLPAKGQKKE